MIKVIAANFILGLTFGWGPCLASCGPLLLAYIAGTGKNVFKSAGAYLLFSLSRIAVYMSLGMAVFFLGRLVFVKIAYLYKAGLLAAGLFIVLVGALMLLGKNMENGLCKNLQKNILEADKKTVIILGLATGLMPCAPLITVISYSSLAARNFFESLLYTFSFGLGTLLSPLFVLAAMAGLLPKMQRPARLFNAICGSVIIIMGIIVIMELKLTAPPSMEPRLMEP